jgi:hypothetical protein
MGINFSHLGFYDLCHQTGTWRTPVISLGTQDIHEPKDEIRAFALRNRHENLAADQTVRSLFRDRYSVVEYLDGDLNDRADLRLDLNAALPGDLVGRFSTVLNAGTVEHVFDIAQALANIHDLIAPGGTIVHIGPISWYQHGYYNLNPLLFSELAKLNNYRLLAEAFHFKSDVLANPSRFSLRAWSKKTIGHPTLYITYDGKEVTPCRAAIDTVFQTALPSDCLYMVAYRKTGSGQFSVPYAIQS